MPLKNHDQYVSEVFVLWILEIKTINFMDEKLRCIFIQVSSQTMSKDQIEISF